MTPEQMQVLRELILETAIAVGRDQVDVTLELTQGKTHDDLLVLLGDHIRRRVDTLIKQKEEVSNAIDKQISFYESVLGVRVRVR